MSALPKAVRAQIAAAEVVAKEFRDSLKPPADPQPAAPAAEPAAPAADPAAAAAASSAAPNEDSWEKRYRVLQGKYNAEVPRLQGQVREQATALERMQNQINMLMVQQTRPANPAPAAPAPAPASTRLVTPEEETQFGKDLIDVIRRTAREEIAPAVASTVASVDTRVKKTEQSAEAAAEAARQAAFDKMMTLLTTQVPNWEELNTDEGFLDWLAQSDPYSGATRQSMMNHAFNHNDGPRVVAFFKGYQNEHATLNPPSAPAPAAPAPEAPAPAATPQSLDKLIAPGTPKAGAGSAPNEASKRIWTEAEIHAFNKARNQLVVARKPVPPSMLETEREIVAAAREGRVRK